MKSSKICTTLVLFGFLIFPGCGTSRRIGGRDLPITITASFNGQEVKGATVYFVRYKDWLSAGLGQDIATTRKAIQPHRVSQGLTPVLITAPAHQFIPVIQWKDRLVWATRPVVPGKDKLVNIELATP